MTLVTNKYWIRFSSLGIVLTAIIIAGTASGSCVLDTTTNFCEQFKIHCKAGQQCAARQAVCIDIDGCGDGITDPQKGEICDDGNIVDGEMMTNGAMALDDCSH